MAVQRVFEEISDWVEAMSKGKPVGIMPAAMAAEVLGLAVSTIKAKLKNDSNDRMRVTIAGEHYVSVEYVQEQIDSWNAEVGKVRKKLERIAARREKIFYGELMASFDMNSRSGGDRNKIGWILGTISRQTYEEHGVFLSAIVHRKGPEPTTAGPGYLGLLESLVDEYEEGEFPYDADRDFDEQLAEHMEAVWDFYEARGKDEGA